MLRGWAARDALVAWGDELAVDALLTRIGQAVLGAVLGLRSLEPPNPMFKWQKHLIGELEGGTRAVRRASSVPGDEREPEPTAGPETLLADTCSSLDAAALARIALFVRACQTAATPSTRRLLKQTV